MNYAYHGLPTDYLEKYRSNIEKVTREDVARVAKKYIQPDQLTLLVVGKPEDFDRPLDSFGEVVALDITIPPPPDTAPKIARTEAGLAEGGKVLARMGAAMGGADAGTIEAIQSRGTVAVSVQGQSFSLGRAVVTVFPDKVRQVLQTPGGEQAIVLNGDQGFILVGGQPRDLPAADVEEASQDLGRELEFLVRYHEDPALEALAGGSDEVDGVTCDVIAVTYRGAESRLWIDGDGRVVKQAYQGKHPFTQAPGQIEMHFGDYKEIEGRQVPHQRKMQVDGEEVMSISVEVYEFNPEVDPTMFEKPEA
jgi:hypothetical protein